MIITDNNGVCIVKSESQRLTSANSKELKTFLEKPIQSGAKIVFDLSNIDFIDSSGLGAILTVQRESQMKGGDVRLADLSSPVLTLFRLTRMFRIFDIYPNLNAAVASFDTPISDQSAIK